MDGNASSSRHDSMRASLVAAVGRGAGRICKAAALAWKQEVRALYFWQLPLAKHFNFPKGRVCPYIGPRIPRPMCDKKNI